MDKPERKREKWTKAVIVKELIKDIVKEHEREGQLEKNVWLREMGEI